MVLKLYKADTSPPVRAAMMACDVFNVPVEMVEVNLSKKENLTPNFIKKNPLHNLPVFEDEDYILHDSHAIMMYLADAYSDVESWYPKDVKERALVNQKLFFEASVLFPRLRNVTTAILIERQKTVNQKWLDSINEAYGFMEAFLTHTKFIAGDQITIADLSAVSDMSSLVCIAPLDPEKFPKTYAWLEIMEEQPYCKKLNSPGVKSLGQMIQDYLKSSTRLPASN